MAKFLVRRHAEPAYVQGLIEAVNKISAQKQCPNEDRILRAVQQEYDWTKTETLKQLKFAVKDGFFTQVTAISSHGKSKGVPQTAFRVRQREKDEVRFDSLKVNALLESRKYSEVNESLRTADHCLASA